MIDIRKPAVATLLFAIGFSASAFAQMDVDQADSLNFQNFHTDKKEAVKVWKDEKKQKSEAVKTYDINSSGSASDSSTTTSVPAAQSKSGLSAAAAASSGGTTAESGQRFELRERYTLSRSAKTPYSAFYVIESMHQQSARHCPKGWKKISERSEPIEQDFHLYYEIECL